MLESLSVKNYKGFEEATIDLKPITLFLGENSAGKTSIIQLLLMLSQTALPSRFKDKSPLDLHGHFAKMGPIEHLFRDKDVSRPFEISIKFSDETLYYYPVRFLREYVRAIIRLTSSIRLAGVSDLLIERNAQGDYLKITEDSLMDTKNFSVFINKFVEVISKPIAQEFLKKSKFFTVVGSGVASADFYNPALISFTSVHMILTKLQKVIKDSSEYTVKYQFSSNGKKIIISKVEISVGKTLLFCLYKGDEDYEFESDLLDRVNMDSRHIDAIRNNFSNNESIFTCFKYPYEYYDKPNSVETTLSNFFLKIVQKILDQLREEFDLNQLYHVGPLRAAPKHYYVLDKENYWDFFDGTDPETCVEILKNNPNTKEFVNKWLGYFGFSVDVSESNEEMINHLVVDQDDNRLNIPEVGFGVSQILPILLQCHFARTDSLTMIEQPEIHLHPKMQARLANLFADVITEKNKKLIIESHSEYMLRRLRRLMAEGKQIKPESVAIYYFERKNTEKEKGSISVRNIEISATGNFDWPGDFYKTEMEDNIAFLRLQE